MSVLLPSLAVAATLLVPISDAVPRLNVEPSCRAAAKMGESLSARLPTCLADEEGARSQLQADWMKFPSSFRQDCIGAATAGGSPSYVELLECLIMRRDAAQMERAERDATKMENAAHPNHEVPARSQR